MWTDKARAAAAAKRKMYYRGALDRAFRRFSIGIALRSHAKYGSVITQKGGPSPGRMSVREGVRAAEKSMSSWQKKANMKEYRRLVGIGKLTRRRSLGY